MFLCNFLGTPGAETVSFKIKFGNYLSKHWIFLGGTRRSTRPAIGGEFGALMLGGGRWAQSFRISRALSSSRAPCAGCFGHLQYHQLIVSYFSRNQRRDVLLSSGRAQAWAAPQGSRNR